MKEDATSARRTQKRELIVNHVRGKGVFDAAGE
jgi:hypothetical protein